MKRRGCVGCESAFLTTCYAPGNFGDITEWTPCRPGYLSRYSDYVWAGLSGDRIPVEARFSASLQTGPGALPDSYTIGTGSFPRVKRPVRDDHPPQSRAEVKERVEL